MNMANMPKRPEISLKEFEQALDAKVLAVIDFDCETFGLAANNGQMIEEFNAKAKSVETFRDIALKMTHRKEIKPERRRSLRSRRLPRSSRSSSSSAKDVASCSAGVERTFAAKACRAAIACAAGDDGTCGAAGRVAAATAAGCRAAAAAGARS